MCHVQLLDRIKQAHPFRDLQIDDLTSLVEGAVLKTYSAAHILFREGDAAKYFYLIDSGEIELFRWAPDGADKTYQLLGAGQLLAEVAMFSDPAAYPMNAQVTKKTKVYCLERSKLINLCLASPEFSLRLMSSMAKKLTQSMNRIDQLTMNNAGQRLVSYLLDLHALQHGQWLELPVSYSILAKQLAIAPETLSRLLQKFREQELISGKRRTLVMLDIDALCDSVGLPRLSQTDLPSYAHRAPNEAMMVGCCNLS